MVGLGPWSLTGADRSLSSRLGLRVSSLPLWTSHDMIFPQDRLTWGSGVQGTHRAQDKKL